MTQITMSIAPENRLKIGWEYHSNADRNEEQTNHFGDYNVLGDAHSSLKTDAMFFV